MKVSKIVFILLAVAGLVAASDPPPEPDYSTYVHIDCHKTGLSNTGTSDEITVEMDSPVVRGEVWRITPSNSDCRSAPNPALSSIHSMRKLPRLEHDRNFAFERIRVTASGENAFWIDRIWSSSPDRNGVNYGFGKEEKKGWCVSTDPEDSFGPDNQSEPCAPCWQFEKGRSAKVCPVTPSS